MNEFLLNILSTLDEYFILIISFSYLLTKIVFRTMIKYLIGSKPDIWDTLAWFSVDIAFINLAICIGRAETSEYNIKIKIIWYLILGGVICLLILMYGFFLKRKKNDIKPINDIKLFINITSSYFISFLTLIISYRNF